MENKKVKLGVLISGSGTNLQKIIDECNDGNIDATVVVVISNNPDAYGIERAKKARIETRICAPEDSASIIEALESKGVDLVVMAGYMKLLPSTVLSKYPDKVMNIHPALLPSFAGAHGIEDAFNYGVKITGVTVHFANEEFDQGAIILQEAVRVEDDETLETLEAKIHEIEYKIYPKAIQLFAAGKLKRVGNKIKIL